MLKRLDYRVILGLLLIAGGGLLLAEKLGYLSRASDLFWGVVFLLAGAAFISLCVGGQWWGAIPGLTLVGISGSILLPEPFKGPSVLAGIAAAFWMVYLMKREFWWAIIPAGVLSTLTLIAFSSSRTDEFQTFILFLGLATTFLLVALLAGLRWAFWPALALAVMAFFFSSSIFGSYLDYLWPAALLLAGIYLIYIYFRKH